MKTAEQFKKELEKAKPGRYELLTEFSGTHKPIKVRCASCGHIWQPPEARSLIRHNCPKCSYMQARTERMVATWEEHLKCIEKNGFTALEEYKGYRTPIKWRCDSCGRIIERRPEDAVLRGIYCDHGRTERNRAKKIRDKHHKDILKKERSMARRIGQMKEFSELLEGYLQNDYEFVSASDNLQSITLRHTKCGNVYTTRKDALKRGHGCPACARCGTSRKVQKVETELKARGIVFEREKRFTTCRRIHTLPFDFAIKEAGEVKALIEVNGEQHYRASRMFGGTEKLDKIQESDQIKREWAKDQGIPLVIIKYNDNVDNKLDALERALRSY